MNLTEIKDNDYSKFGKKRVGRGIGSGMGKTSTKGHKGQKARGKVAVGFEGGQSPLYIRFPKRGFNNKNFRTNYYSITVAKLLEYINSEKLSKSEEITLQSFINSKIIKMNKYEGLKLIGSQVDFISGVSIKCSKITEGARKTVESAGSKVELI